MILTLKELAEYLKVNERTILRMHESGQIQGVKIGGQWRFNGSQIDKMFFPTIRLPGPTRFEVPYWHSCQWTMDVSRVLLNLHSDCVEDVIEELTHPKIFNNLY